MSTIQQQVQQLDSIYSKLDGASANDSSGALNGRNVVVITNANIREYVPQLEQTLLDISQSVVANITGMSQEDLSMAHSSIEKATTLLDELRGRVTEWTWLPAWVCRIFSLFSTKVHIHVNKLYDINTIRSADTAIQESVKTILPSHSQGDTGTLDHDRSVPSIADLGKTITPVDSGIIPSFVSGTFSLITTSFRNVTSAVSNIFHNGAVQEENVAQMADDQQGHSPSTQIQLPTPANTVVVGDEEPVLELTTPIQVDQQEVAIEEKIIEAPHDEEIVDAHSEQFDEKDVLNISRSHLDDVSEEEEESTRSTSTPLSAEPRQSYNALEDHPIEGKKSDEEIVLGIDLSDIPHEPANGVFARIKNWFWKPKSERQAEANQEEIVGTHPEQSDAEDSLDISRSHLDEVSEEEEEDVTHRASTPLSAEQRRDQNGKMPVSLPLENIIELPNSGDNEPQMISRVQRWIRENVVPGKKKILETPEEYRMVIEGLCVGLDKKKLTPTSQSRISMDGINTRSGKTYYSLLKEFVQTLPKDDIHNLLVLAAQSHWRGNNRQAAVAFLQKEFEQHGGRRKNI